jgi:S1/P1 Nuclease
LRRAGWRRFATSGKTLATYAGSYHMKFTQGLALLAVGCLAVPGPALAWGYEGHKVVAAIAQAYLTPAAKRQVDALLAADTDPLEPHDMLSAATWADTWRRDHRETAQWHFVDLELSKPDLDTACFGHPPAAVPASAGPAQACIIDRLNAFETELANPATPQAERIVALKFVLHFVGDLHQPLHASDDQDQGGNCVRLALSDARTTNLHSYWDTGLVVAMGSDPVMLAQTLRARITPTQKAAWEKGDAKSWALESYAIAKSTAYWPGAPAGCARDAAPAALPAGYDAAAQTAIALQLEKAGVRLARVLNQALG